MNARALILMTVLTGLLDSPAIAADAPCLPISISPEELPPGHFAEGVWYPLVTLNAAPLSYYDFSVSQGVLPTGLALSGAYANRVDISGLAGEAGTFIFTITAHDPLTGCSGGRTFAPTVFECGNLIVDVEVGEMCDDGDTVGGDGCSANCLSDETCNNGYVDPGEQCDGDDPQGSDCNSLGLGVGDLSCDPVTCDFDTSACTLCGNGVIDAGEQCDGDDLQGFDCSHLDSAAAHCPVAWTRRYAYSIRPAVFEPSPEMAFRGPRIVLAR